MRRKKESSERLSKRNKVPVTLKELRARRLESLSMASSLILS
ncbi:hypothetical protein COXBURSA334_1247 [Coxiella burnetii Q321]|nr:hypothetical protein COXBURSA334_1247 [Coxiella burnetii Q321]